MRLAAASTGTPGWNCTATNHGCDGSSAISTNLPSGERPEMRMPFSRERRLVEAVELEAVAMPLVDQVGAVDPFAPAIPAPARRRSGRGASCRPVRRRRAGRAACRSPCAARSRRPRLNRRRRARRRCARTRRSPTGSRSRCRRTGCRASRAYSAAFIMPRVPREPNPPGTRMPCAPSSSATPPSFSSASASTQLKSTLQRDWRSRRDTPPR